MTKGIVLRLFKKNVPDFIEDGNHSYRIFSFMHFDWINPYHVEKFSDYGDLISGRYNADIRKSFNYDSRKLYLIDRDSSNYTQGIPDILSAPKGGTYNDCPVMLVCLLEFKQDDGVNRHTLISSGVKELSRQLDCCTDIYFKYKFFDCLGLADVMLVIRAKSIGCTYKVLENIYDGDSPGPRFLYSIPTLLWKLREEWYTSGDTPEVSIRVALNDISYRSYNQVMAKVGEFLELDEPAWQIFKAQWVFGQYDVVFTGVIKDDAQSRRKFIDFLNIRTPGDNILSTHTSFLMPPNPSPNPNRNTAPSEDDTAIQLNETARKAAKEIENYIGELGASFFGYLSCTEKPALTRIFTRLGYIATSVYYFKDYASDTSDFAKMLNLLAYDICYHRQTESNLSRTRSNRSKDYEALSNMDVREVNFTEFLDHVYTYIENRIMSAHRDFDSRDRLDLSYAEGAHLLKAYSKFFATIKGILEATSNLFTGKDQFENHFFVMVDNVNMAKLSLLNIRDRFNESVKHRYGFFHVPLGIAYNVPHVMALALHEQGHLVSPEADELNKRFLTDVVHTSLNNMLIEGIRQILSELSEYSIENINQDVSDVVKRFYYKAFGVLTNGIDPINEEIFRSVAVGENVRRDAELSEIVKAICFWLDYSFSGFVYDSIFDICEDTVDIGESELSPQVGKLCIRIKGSIYSMAEDVWKEAFADVFMVEALGFKAKSDYKAYLDIMKAYFKNIATDGSHQYKVVRYCAVCMYICPERFNEPGDIEEVLRHIDDVFPGSEHLMRENYKEVDRSVVFSHAKRLSDTLKKLLMDRYEDAFKREEILQKLTPIREIYQSFQPESGDSKFEAAVSFMDQYG
ncbi:MAG: hypothetical protein FWE20_08375 [Defluviitaleaceae bacterium]|nr:hypothetical protein [Defluviitaleaceae bacterium]